MQRANLRKAFSLLLITALLLGVFSSLVLAQETPVETPTAEAPTAEAMAEATVEATAETAPAPVAGAPVSAKSLAGTLTGGQFARLWLGLTPDERDAQITLIADWDRDAPTSNGVTFYVLTAANVASVNAGGTLQANNIAAGGAFSQGQGNQQIAGFKATDGAYTVIMANDSATDANFTISATNAVLTDDSGQARDPNAAMVAPEAAPVVEAAPVAAPVTETVATTVTTVTTTTTVEAAPVAEVAVVAPGTPVVVQQAELKGSLPGDGVQHYLGLTPNERDGNISLTLAYDPQDNQELARRMNFWVLDAQGLQRYVDGTPASDVAVAAGSRSFTGPANERVATFNATGLGPYTVIVYNNSLVPATYSLAAVGGLLLDDAGQTDTAKALGVAAPVAASAATTATTATTATAATAATTTAAATTPGREGEPGGTYTVKAGDTLALIARDIYGDYTLYQAICTFNGIADCARIEIGDVIKLPTQAEIGANATAPAAAATPAAATPAATTATTATTALTETVAATTTAATTGTTAGLPTATAVATTAAPVATPAAGTTPAATGSTIVEVAEANGNFTTLIKALKAAGLDDDLAGAGPYTVFAPTDAAFNALGAATVDALLKDTRKLQQILLYHVVGDEIMSTDLTNGMEVVTLQGSPVGFTLTGATAKVQDSNIVVADVEASNGVIHVIDKVMLPPVP